MVKNLSHHNENKFKFVKKRIHSNAKDAKNRRVNVEVASAFQLKVQLESIRSKDIPDKKIPEDRAQVPDELEWRIQLLFRKSRSLSFAFPLCTSAPSAVKCILKPQRTQRSAEAY